MMAIQKEAFNIIDDRIKKAQKAFEIKGVNRIEKDVQVNNHRASAKNNLSEANWLL